MVLACFLLPHLGSSTLYLLKKRPVDNCKQKSQATTYIFNIFLLTAHGPLWASHPVMLLLTSIALFLEQWCVVKFVIEMAKEERLDMLLLIFALETELKNLQDFFQQFSCAVLQTSVAHLQTVHRTPAENSWAKGTNCSQSNLSVPPPYNLKQKGLEELATVCYVICRTRAIC